MAQGEQDIPEELTGPHRPHGDITLERERRLKHQAAGRPARCCRPHTRGPFRRIGTVMEGFEGDNAWSPIPTT